MNERFARHQLVEGWDQQRLAQAKVIMAGVGALGNEVARLLAMAGVGRLLLCDPDRVSLSNLSRTVLFRSTDVGRWKVEAAAESLRQLAPEVTVETRARPLILGIGLAELRDANLVISCLDSHASRVQLAGRCNLVRAAMLDGGTRPWGGEVRPFLDTEGPCYACTLSNRERGLPDAANSCLPEVAVGAEVFSTSLVGSWMATLAVRYLLGLPLPNHLLQVNAATGGCQTIGVARNPDCPLHRPIGETQQVHLGANPTVGELLACLEPDDMPLLWQEVEIDRSCTPCGYRADVLQEKNLFCPHCGARLVANTTLEMNKLPGDALLNQYIPPSEIMAVRKRTGVIDWIELAGEYL